MTKQEVIDCFEMGNIGDVEFFELAQDAGMSIEEIGEILERQEELSEPAWCGHCGGTCKCGEYE